jgi:hypothetical protein
VSLALKIPVFLGFLIFFAIWMAATIFAGLQAIKGLRSVSTVGLISKGLLPLEVVGYVGLFGTLGILALFFNPAVIGLMLGTTALGYVITVIAWALLGPFERPFGSDMTWANATLLVRPWFQPIQNGLGTLTTVAMLIGLAYLYFARDVPSTEATRDMFKVLILWMSAGFLITVLPLRLSTLTSRNLDEAVRDRILAAQAGTLFTWAILVSLVLWSFEFEPSGARLSWTSVDAGFSLAVGVILAAFFLFTSVVPYLIGTVRAKQWRHYLREKRRRWLQQVEEALRTPSEAGRETRLQDVREELGRERDTLVSDPLLALAAQWEDVGASGSDTLGQLSPFVYDAYQDIREADPRVEQLHIIDRLRSEVAMLEGELTSAPDANEKAARYAENYANARKNLGEQIVAEKGQRSWILAAAVFAISGVASTVQSKVGERIWEIVGT